ncbi:MAG: hypothetical protein WBK55_07675 [Alphaproteobacteria bacterium]
MTLEIVPQNARFTPINLSNFIEHLRRHQQKSIISSGSYLCWEAFRNPEFKSKLSSQLQLIESYAPKIILLALATANNQRNLTVNNEEFYNLCSSFLHIRTPISDKPFLDLEAKKITEELNAVCTKKGNIPVERIHEELIRASCSIMFISRGVTAQHRNFKMSLEEMFRDYLIIKHIDSQTSNEASRILKNIFGIDTLQIFRSAFGLFSVANDTNRNGSLNFGTLTCDVALTDRLKIDLTTCLSVATNTSYKESDLRENWLNKEVLSEHELYQSYAPDPLSYNPIIHRDRSVLENQFLIPSPGLFFRGFRQSLFSILYQNASNKGDMGRQIGNAIETHIEVALKSIFSKDRVTKIQSDERQADFLIQLEKIDLIIEIKSMIGGISDKFVMRPDHTAKMWNRLYSACTQCASSLKTDGTKNKPIIPIILIADHITAEHLPFDHYAFHAGLYKDSGINAIEYISWNSLEDILSKTSIAEFEKALLKKWKDPARVTVGTSMALDLNRDTPAHEYQYLKDAEVEIFMREI